MRFGHEVLQGSQARAFHAEPQRSIHEIRAPNAVSFRPFGMGRCSQRHFVRPIATCTPQSTQYPKVNSARTSINLPRIRGQVDRSLQTGTPSRARCIPPRSRSERSPTTRVQTGTGFQRHRLAGRRNRAWSLKEPGPREPHQGTRSTMDFPASIGGL